MDLHVFPIPIPPPTSLSIRSLLVFNFDITVVTLEPAISLDDCQVLGASLN